MEKLTNTLKNLGHVPNAKKDKSCETFKFDLYFLIRSIVHHSSIKLSQEKLTAEIINYVLTIQKYENHNKLSELYQLCDEYLKPSLNDICRHNGCLKLFGGAFSTDSTKRVIEFIPKIVNLVFQQRLSLFQTPTKAQQEELLLLVESESSTKIEDLWYCSPLLNNKNNPIKFEFSQKTQKIYKQFLGSYIKTEKFSIIIRQDGKLTEKIIELIRFIEKTPAQQTEHQQEYFFAILKSIIVVNNSSTINSDNKDAAKLFLLQAIELYCIGYLNQQSFINFAQTLSDEIIV